MQPYRTASLMVQLPLVTAYIAMRLCSMAAAFVLVNVEKTGS